MPVKIPQIATLALILAISACATLAPRERLAQAETAYAALVNTAVDLRLADVIDDDQARQLTPAFERANELLSAAHDAIVEGRYNEAEQITNSASRSIAELARRIRRHDDQ